MTGMRSCTAEVSAFGVVVRIEQVFTRLPSNLAVASTGKEHHGRGLRPNLERLTVGVDLGDQWSHYCILDLEGSCDSASAAGRMRRRERR
jgi:hypothetical protein